jgi:hypothetical protein
MMTEPEAPISMIRKRQPSGVPAQRRISLGRRFWGDTRLTSGRTKSAKRFRDRATRSGSAVGSSDLHTVSRCRAFRRSRHPVLTAAVGEPQSAPTALCRTCAESWTTGRLIVLMTHNTDFGDAFEAKPRTTRLSAVRSVMPLGSTPLLCHDTLIRARSGNLQTSSHPPLVTIRRIAAPVR